ncbi:transmembrane protein 59-like [Mercenaria mercenaria]|uniref:transmembrane protein 59-like n=1 Tax=Mercenaria mercenaria TaxID=6596 RepID=UPI00234F4A62|nr:transmembrane protein 59-like [Mercenaria mercenaria]
MMEFLYDNVNKTTKVCYSSCSEAYPDKDDFEACKLGCSSQKPFALDHILREDPWEQQIHFMSPMMYMHQWYSNVFNNIMNQATVSWTMYMRDNDGSVVVVKSPKQFKVYELRGADEDSSDGYNTASSLETNIKPMDNSATPFLKNPAYNPSVIDDDLIDLSALQEEANDWLSCVAKKTGISRLILSWLLLMCAIVMIWLCLSAAVTSPEQKVYTEPQKLSINGDQEIIAEMLARGIKPTYPIEKKSELQSLPIKISVHRI